MQIIKTHLKYKGNHGCNPQNHFAIHPDISIDHQNIRARSFLCIFKIVHL